MRWAMSGNEAASMTTDCQPVQCLAYTLHPATAHPPDSSGVCRSTLAVSEFRLLLLEGRAWPKPSQTGEILGGREVRMTPVPSTTFVFGPLLAAQTPFWPLLAAQTPFWSAAAEPTGASTTMIYTQVLNRGRPESAAPPTGCSCRDLAGFRRSDHRKRSDAILRRLAVYPAARTTTHCATSRKLTALPSRSAWSARIYGTVGKVRRVQERSR
jgi:hypothetical protein